MKISASKKQLARIISENGGWRDGAEWAAQDKLAWGSYNLIVLYTNEPSEPKAGGKYWTGKDLGINSSIISNELLTNWYQTKINRDEYFHLYPAPDAEGWIEWKGGECPVPPETLVICRLLGDHEWKGGYPVKAGSMRWDLKGILDIIAYRLHKSEKSKSTAVGDDETNMAAKEELEALESGESPEQRAKLAKIYAPSIEQLATDYRAKLEIAQQAQEEADSHRCGAEAALEKLVAAGKAHGLVLGVAAPEAELVINDWRDLRVGDVIWVGDSWCGSDSPAGEYTISDIDFNDQEQPVCVWYRTSIQCPRIHNRGWRFIRRP